MERKTDKFREYVQHPRYGKRPNITGLNPSPMDANVRLHWNTTTFKEIVAQYEFIVGRKWPHGDYSAYARQTKRISNTAIVADTEKQSLAMVPITHYFDLERRCKDCERQFIFFAQEQKYWYEELGFGLESDCIRCVECRKKQQGVARLRETYESLFHLHPRTEVQTIEMATACLALIDSGVFSNRKREFVRMLLNSIDSDSEYRTRSDFDAIVKRSKLNE